MPILPSKFQLINVTDDMVPFNCNNQHKVKGNKFYLKMSKGVNVSFVIVNGDVCMCLKKLSIHHISYIAIVCDSSNSITFLPILTWVSRV